MTKLVSLACCVIGLCATVALGALPRPLEGHPGNIFLAGESVEVAAPGGTGPVKVTDYDGKVVKEADVAGNRVQLGQLGVGYYELRREGGAMVTVGVLAPLAAPTPKSSPIGVDVAMSWFYSKDQKPAVANLCVLAGMSWVRDRLAWGEMEQRPGEFTKPPTRYDESARVQADAGLQVLQVNHSSPPWYADRGRFPDDLRDVYRFYEAMARRWKGEVKAFEPWNEADIPMFGGQTGAEMASLQKAAWWGLKTGNPDVIVCENVFASARPASLKDMVTNQAWKYADTCNLHHYIPVDQFAQRYAEFRAISGGRPLWTTEFAMPVQWTGDEQAKELSETEARRQANHLVMAFAGVLNEGTQTFYFLLPHYAEGKTQFGIIRRDLTPRPAFLSLAAVGRLLADAKPVGRLKSDDAAIRGYLFRAMPDGKPKTVLVAWATGGTHPLKVAHEAVFDAIGRPVAVKGELTLTWSPLFAVMPAGAEKSLAFEPAPTMPARQTGRPSPVVLQAVGGKERTELNRSAYLLKPGQKQRLPVYAYCFGPREHQVSLSIQKPEGWKVDFPETAMVKPGERVELPMDLTPLAGQGTVHVRARADGMPTAVLSIRFDSTTGEKK